jgi:hypothetical protein
MKGICKHRNEFVHCYFFQKGEEGGEIKEAKIQMAFI